MVNNILQYLKKTLLRLINTVNRQQHLISSNLIFYKAIGAKSSLEVFLVQVTYTMGYLTYIPFQKKLIF